MRDTEVPMKMSAIHVDERLEVRPVHLYESRSKLLELLRSSAIVRITPNNTEHVPAEAWHRGQPFAWLVSTRRSGDYAIVNVPGGSDWIEVVRLLSYDYDGRANDIIIAREYGSDGVARGERALAYTRFAEIVRQCREVLGVKMLMRFFIPTVSGPISVHAYRNKEAVLVTRRAELRIIVAADACVGPHSGVLLSGTSLTGRPEVVLLDAGTFNVVGRWERTEQPSAVAYCRATGGIVLVQGDFLYVAEDEGSGFKKVDRVKNPHWVRCRDGVVFVSTRHRTLHHFRIREPHTLSEEPLATHADRTAFVDLIRMDETRAMPVYAGPGMFNFTLGDPIRRTWE